ncbi:hypothetical protein TBR22_A14560 [Luteitalea sp. TBR-22]|uniref:NIPSNAP family protein n=1 Tax=Luteitalea sp. TBR-22 TaxID=2802971 RepID=UPI001AF2CA94|nr:NIPSNAP family protein [Luteitalea sp. TBR-22]BCS32246.1 hypothetical protein TBR22_A14560 [Luteitalea sp. TBR-22]
MSTTRRSFLSSTLAASAAAAASTGLYAQKAPASKKAAREYYELRAYRLKPGASPDLLDGYLEKAFLPALASQKVGPVGVFTEIDVDKQAQTGTPKADTPVWVLIRHRTLDSFVRVSTAINTDPSVVKAGATYLQVPKATPAFDRIDTWLYLAFAGQPTMTMPAHATSRVPTRVFEMRDYESHSEERALSKMEMFNDGEIEVMHSLGMGPVFFGQGIAGPNLPHLRYFTSGPDLKTHLDAWKKFGPDPRWVAMKDKPQYKDNTSKNTARFLVPRPYSQI